MKNGILGWIVIALLAAALVCCGYFELFRQTVIVTVTPASEQYFANPMMGFAPWSNDKSIDQSVTLVYMDATWAELEPENGVYAFEALEQANHCDRWRAQGKRMVFRLVCDKPGSKKHIDIPQWLFDATGGDGCFYDTEYGQGYSPNYANPLFISEHAELMAAIGERYGRDEFVYYVELGSIGHWGEWHVNTGDGVPPLPPTHTLALYARHYAAQFPPYRLLMRRPFDFAVSAGFGLYNDMTGDAEATEEFLDWIESGGSYNGEKAALSAYTDGWKYAPVGGEIYSHFSPGDYLGAHTERTIALLCASHTTFIGPGCPNDVPAEYAADANRVRAAIGYRYRVASSKRTIFGAIGRRQRLDVTLLNDGAAPLYQAWELMLYYRDAEGNAVYRQHTGHFANEILPGSGLAFSVMTNFNESEGAVRVDLVIEDPRTVEPAIRWAMDDHVGGDGYYATLIDDLQIG